jgi:D-mannonate dehydratase
MINPDRIVHSIGLDLDSKDKQNLNRVQKNASHYGIIQTTSSKNGYHIKVKLNIPVKLKESLWLRFHLSDDPLRLLFDCLRIISNEDNLDILWDIKEKKQLNSIMKKLEVLN